MVPIDVVGLVNAGELRAVRILLKLWGCMHMIEKVEGSVSKYLVSQRYDGF